VFKKHTGILETERFTSNLNSTSRSNTSVTEHDRFENPRHQFRTRSHARYLGISSRYVRIAADRVTAVAGGTRLITFASLARIIDFPLITGISPSSSPTHSRDLFDLDETRTRPRPFVSARASMFNDALE